MFRRPPWGRRLLDRHVAGRSRQQRNWPQLDDRELKSHARQKACAHVLASSIISWERVLLCSLRVYDPACHAQRVPCRQEETSLGPAWWSTVCSASAETLDTGLAQTGDWRL
eukprot:scaffold5496_cov112-Isochrysis_galbana.AAC.2